MLPTIAQPDTVDVVALLREYGLKVTAPRKAVIAALVTKPHAAVDEVFELVRQSHPTTSLQAMYSILGAYVVAGIVQRIEPAGSPARYEMRTGDNHHHAVCEKCEKIFDIDCAVGAAPCLLPESAGDFLITRAEVIYWGLCAVCETARTQSTETSQAFPASELTMSS
jgi:Fur family ferric uptake transcriptional regulator